MSRSDWIWDNEYIVSVIGNNDDIEEMVEQVELDNQETFNEWRDEEDTYGRMIELTEEQIETLNN